MTEKEAPKAQNQADNGRTATGHRPSRATPPPVPVGVRLGRGPNRDAGAVLRRTADPDRPGSWRIAQPRPRPSIVDTMDGHGPHASNVDTADSDGSPAFDIGTEAGPERHPHAFNVDITEGPMPFPDGGPSSDYNVDIMDELEFAPKPRSVPPVPTRLKGPENRKHMGPSGPDSELIRRLREAHKRRVADRAKARGRDPGAGSRETEQGVTRSEKTHEQYLKRGRLLVKRFRRETGNSDLSLDSLNPVEFVNWLFSLKPSLKATAWRPYRQSAKAILSTLPHDNTEAALAMLDADIAESGTSSPPEPKEPKSDADRNKLPRRTSSLKEKKFPKEDFDRVISYLRHFSRSALAPILIDWLVAGVATGLRPIEWQATDVEIREDPNAPGGRYIWLYVLNAKATNGRANGIVRTLDLSHFRDETVRAVQRMSRNGNEWLLNGSYDTKQSQCAQLLYSVSEKLFRQKKKVYSLYSARHQFVANAKSYHKPEAVSALVGHIVTDTAISSYGKKRSCWAPEDIKDRPEPVAEEVATVRQRHVFFEERVRMQQEAGLLKTPKVAAGEDD